MGRKGGAPLWKFLREILEEGWEVRKTGSWCHIDALLTCVNLDISNSFLLGSLPSSPKAKAWHLHISKEWVWGIEKKKVSQYGKIGTIPKNFPETGSARHDGEPANHSSGGEGRDGQERNRGLLWMRPALVWDFACLFQRSWKTGLVSAQKTWLYSLKRKEKVHRGRQKP